VWMVLRRPHRVDVLFDDRFVIHEREFDFDGRKETGKERVGVWRSRKKANLLTFDNLL
jgi:hypothetical protein